MNSDSMAKDMLRAFGTTRFVIDLRAVDDATQ